MRSFRKGLLFLFVDVAIIIGIFVLQFRTDSSILEKFGKLQLSLELSNAEENITVLSNKLQVLYNGLNFHSDDQNCAALTFKDSSRKEIKLTNWQKTSDLSFCLNFTEGVLLNFILSGDDAAASLSVTANLPDDAEALYLPFNYSYSMKLLSQDNGKLVLNDKKNSWDLTIPEYQDGFLLFSQIANSANYAIHDNTKKFTFDMLTELSFADPTNFNTILSELKTNLITAVKQNLTDSNISERVVVAYIAAMAEEGKYQQAIDDVPQNLKRGNQRSYISAPYLNNLVNMNKTLDSALKEKDSLIAKASYTNFPAIFTEENIAAFLTIYKDTTTAKRVLENAADYVINNLTLAQTVGILKSYCDFLSLNPEYAIFLKPCISGCIEKITNSCSFDNNVLVISENGSFLSVVQAVEIGTAILRYGLSTDDETLIKAGRVIISSYIAESSAFDVRTLANIYTILAYNNKYYPHFEIINKEGGNKIWAWTCAQSIELKKINGNTTEFLIDFPTGASHYVIFHGIPNFDTIYLYNIAYRTDPRFETYNSSGYIYQKENEVLLLKSRHKSQIETVRIESSTTKDF